MIAYVRAFGNDKDTNSIKVGRVLTLERGTGLGRKILVDAIKEIKNKMKPKNFLWKLSLMP